MWRWDDSSDDSDTAGVPVQLYVRELNRETWTADVSPTLSSLPVCGAEMRDRGVGVKNPGAHNLVNVSTGATRRTP